MDALETLRAEVKKLADQTTDLVGRNRNLVAENRIHGRHLGALGERNLNLENANLKLQDQVMILQQENESLREQLAKPVVAADKVNGALVEAVAPQ